MIKIIINTFLHAINNYLEFEKKILSLKCISINSNHILKMINKLPKRYRIEAMEKCSNASLQGHDIKDITLEVRLKINPRF